jgi:hypothetical protein
LDWHLWRMAILELLAQLHSSMPYVHMGLIATLYPRTLFSRDNGDFLPKSQYSCLNLRSICFLFFTVHGMFSPSEFRIHTLQLNPTRQRHTLLLWRNKNGFGCRSFRLAMKTRVSYVSHLGSEGPRCKKYLTQWLYSSRISGDSEPLVVGKIYQSVSNSLNILYRRVFKREIQFVRQYIK